MADEKKGLGTIFGVADFVSDVLVAGMLFPLLKTLAEKGISKMGKEVEKKLGLNDTEEAKKTTDDNDSYSEVVMGMSATDAPMLVEFEKKLLAEEDGDKKFAALVLFLYNGMQRRKKEITKTTGGDKNSKTPKESSKSVDYSDGIAWAILFLKSLISEKTFEDQLFCLEKRYDVFSLIKTEKTKIDLLTKAIDILTAGKKKFGPFFEKAKEAVTAGAGSVDLTRGVRSLSDRIKRM